MEDAVSDVQHGPMAVLRWEELDDAARGRLLDRGRDKIFDPALRASVGEILEDVRTGGDAAVIRALAKFDGCTVQPGGLAVTDEEFERAEGAVSNAIKDALRQGIANIRAFNEALTA